MIVMTYNRVRVGGRMSACRPTCAGFPIALASSSVASDRRAAGTSPLATLVFTTNIGIIATLLSLKVQPLVFFAFLLLLLLLLLVVGLATSL